MNPIIAPVIAIALAIATIITQAAEFHVAPGGSDSNAGTAAAPVATVAQAIQRAGPGETCILHGGDYFGPVACARSGAPGAPITLGAAPGERPRLCEAKRYSSYNNRWSDHIVSVEGGKVRFQLQGDGPLETTARFNDGQWHHVVTTVGLGGQRLHVDGRLIATGKLTKRSKTSNRLGLDLGPGDRHAVVTLDEVSILGRAITPSEVNQGIKP